MGGGIKQCFCLTSVAYIGSYSRTERPRKTKIGTEVAHVTRDSDTTFKVKGQGHQAALVGCSSNYIIYMDGTIIITKASRYLSIMNIHGAGRRRLKACMGWSWAAACGIQGREHIVWPHAQLVVNVGK